MKSTAIVICNDGIGDKITIIGLVNFLGKKYKHVIIACQHKTRNALKHFYAGENIILYPIKDTEFYEFYHLMKSVNMYDVFACGNYGANVIHIDNYTKLMSDGEQRKIISNYPCSYYEDCGIPISTMTEYFCVSYPKEIIAIYDTLFSLKEPFQVIHQESSQVNINIIEFCDINIDDMLTIDVNKNLYTKNHKYYNVANLFVNLPSVTYYTKLLETCKNIYIIDSCIHALCLVIDVTKVETKICYVREHRFKYAFNKFKYYQLIFHK